MPKKNIITKFFAQLTNIGIGVRIAAGMLTASLRSVYTLCMLLLFNAVFLLYYFDLIHRTLFAGGSSIAWALINMVKKIGFTLPTHVFGVEWLLHLPEYLIVYGLLGLLNLMMVHIVNNYIDSARSCGVGRAFFRAVRSWRVIGMYALSMSIIIWFVGDVYSNCTRWVLVKISQTPALIEGLYDPVYGKKVLDFLIHAPYWLSINMRLGISLAWYFSTFLLFPIVVTEECSFFAAVGRSCAIALRNAGLVFGTAFSYLLIYVGIMVATLYGQMATFPSLEGLATRSSVQVIVLFAFMTLILFTVHAAVVSTGSLIASVYLYRMGNYQRIPIRPTFFTEQPYWSCSLYLLFYLFYWIIIRCGIHVQMPTI